ncbi:MAG: (d)CMP kinase [Oscillospiraceae bacterium]|nr:(d)CMP kinase [Oscillospiraceae bacterium]
MEYINVALDGPAGAGKSSIAKSLAEELGYIYIDTGAMYRSIAVYAIESGIDIKNQRNLLINSLDNINVDIKYKDGTQHIFLNGNDVSERIREADATKGSSDVAVIPEVRLKLVALQRSLAAGANVIMDGRDIATHVLPDAQVKIYLTASVEERAARRLRQMRERGTDGDIKSVEEDIRLRDKQDSEREFAPLRRAEDAVLLDTSDMNFEESVAAVKKIILEKTGELDHVL